MFTGIIEEVGTLNKIVRIPGGKKFKISSQKVLSGLKADDSVAVDGVCLTAVRVENDGFWVDAVGETLAKSSLDEMREGRRINLERALRLSDRLGGHLVQGHVNGTGRIVQIVKRGDNYLFEIELPADITRYIIIEGSITIDGISLTIAQLNGNKIGISVIPYTLEHTTLNRKKTGEIVNIEVDVIAKYVERLLQNKVTSENGEIFSDKWFKKLGY